MVTNDGSILKTTGSSGIPRIALRRGQTRNRSAESRDFAAVATKRELAFTLVELTIAVAVLSILAVVAIPGLPQARISANERSAIGTLKTITVSNGHYRARFGSFPASLSDLVNAGYINSGGSSPFKAGYTFTYTRSSAQHFEATAKPTRPGETGIRYFFVDDSGVIRFSKLGPTGGGRPRV